ncbi:MAG: germacradienol/geosmin synthase, partial [Actinomycetia bacterium]|nr:germacradienol/geosmin synthase [Actinomycetes bacterium]
GVQLPALFEEFALDERAREALLGYVQELRDWMAGILNWHRNSRRYTGTALRRDFPLAAAPAARAAWTAAPAGLGTAAARLPVQQR